MTVDTPFPERPATPFWDPRGMGDFDPSEITSDITDVFRPDLGISRRTDFEDGVSVGDSHNYPVAHGSDGAAFQYP